MKTLEKNWFATLATRITKLGSLWATPQTAGYGLTLTSAHTVIYYSNDFNLETRVQSEDRCHRIGQNHPVTYIDLVAEGTVDEHIVKALRNKIQLAGAALGEEMRQWLKVK